MSATHKNNPDTNQTLSGSEIYDKAQKLTTQGIDRQLKKFFSELNKATFHHISPRDRDRLIAQVQRKQDIILSSILFQIKNNFADFKTSRQFRSQRSITPNNQVLGLVGGNYYTESEEMDSIAQRFQERYNDYYERIASQLAICIDRTNVSGIDNPLHVKHLCQSFQTAIESLNLVSAQKIALYRVFADSVIDRLDSLYIKLEECFIKYHPQSEPEAVTIEPPVEEISPTASTQSNSLAMSHIPTLMGIFQTIKDKSNDNEAVHSDLLLELKESLAHKGIVEFDSVIDKLSVLFNVILADEDLPQRIKQQLARLQPFVFMSEIQKSGFAVKSSHPARRLIDTIIRTEVDFDKSNQSDRSGFELLRSEIDKISNNLFIEEDYYVQLCQLYSEHTSESIAKPTQSTQPTPVAKQIDEPKKESPDIKPEETEHNQGTVDIVLETEKPVRPVAKVDNIYPVVQSIVNDIVLPLKMQGRSLILFDEVWVPLLLKVATNQGFKSQAWHKIVTIVKTQAWVLIPKSRQADLDKLKSTLTNIEKSLTQSMQSLAMPADQQASLLEFLEHEQADIIRQSIALINESKPVKEQPVDTSPSTSDSRETAGLSSDATKETVDEFSDLMNTGRFHKSDDMLEALEFENKVQPVKIEPTARAANIHKSDWIEIKKGGSVVLAKLTWKNDTNSQYIFVDREGHRVCEISGEDLDRELKEGNISLISSAPVRSQRPASSIIQTFS